MNLSSSSPSELELTPGTVVPFTLDISAAMPSVGVDARSGDPDNVVIAQDVVEDDGDIQITVLDAQVHIEIVQAIGNKVTLTTRYTGSQIPASAVEAQFKVDRSTVESALRSISNNLPS